MGAMPVPAAAVLQPAFRLSAPSPVVLRPTEAAQLWEAVKAPIPIQPGAHHLGEALVLSGLISEADLRRALKAQEHISPHVLLGELLVEAGVLTETGLRAALASWLGLHVVDVSALTVDPVLTAKVPRAFAEREMALPLLQRNGTAVVAMAEPWDHRVLDELRFMTQMTIVPVLAAPGTLLPAIDRAYRAPELAPAQSGGIPLNVHQWADALRDASPETGEPAAEAVSESDSALVRFVDALIREAIQRKASDIHIETGQAGRPVRIRLRIDGELVPHLELPARYRYALVARIKIMSDLDIAEHRRPQDGKIDFSRFGGPPLELRVVTVPTAHAQEDVVLRLLNAAASMPLEGIGLSDANLAGLRSMMVKPYGLILVCGPTGCGKTTTLHSVLRELNVDRRKIWTAEDPIEITQEGLRQVQVNARIDWTFAAAMRTFLRADPDVIMIGEMRDEETARIAIEASLTGHLVLSTLHTNSAPESITRLLEIGLDPFNFSDSLLGILAQRLVRRLCTHCRTSGPVTGDMLHELARLYLASGASSGSAESVEAREQLVGQWRAARAQSGGLRMYRAHGCERCGGDGYHGRLGLHELMVSDNAVRQLVRHRAAADELQAAALRSGMKTIRQDGIEKVLDGLTDLPEVLAATNG